MEKKVILIGGTPCVGKSFSASSLSKEFGIPWFSTDSIREFMREIANPEEYPSLFYFLDKKPEDYLLKHSPKQVMEDQNKESHDVWKGVKAWINTDYEWDSFIVEGIAVLPELVARDFGGCKGIKAVFLFNQDKEKIREVIYKRGLWAKSKEYSDDVKEKEVEWVLAFNDWLKKEVKRCGFLAIESEGGVFDIKKLADLVEAETDGRQVCQKRQDRQFM